MTPASVLSQSPGARLDPRDARLPGASDSMMVDLPRVRCLELLSLHHFGRLVATTPGGSPVIRPVNYVFDRSSMSVAFRTGQGSKLHALLSAATAVFEIDGVDMFTRTGWSVIMSGVAVAVTRPHDIDRLERLGLQPWTSGEKPRWMRIRAWTLSGRSIVLPGSVVPGQYLG